ncbi:MAG: hypothetical protein AAGI13_06010 [Pseudomonadota bacterium]
MRIHQGFLANRSWPILASLLCLSAAAVWVLYAPDGRREGSTVVGYALGGLSAFIVLWLSWLGVMKRRFASSSVRRRNKVSAHIWLGLSLIVLVGLHSGFVFDYSIHTLAYLLLIIVVFSGIFGIWCYGSVPRLMNANVASCILEKRRADISDVEQLELDISEIDQRIERALQFLPDAFRAPVRQSLERTRIGGGLFSILMGSSRGCATSRALDKVRALAEGPSGDGEHRARIPDLIEDLTRKAEVAACLRRDTRYRALLTLWLWLHVPLTLALIVTVAAHIMLVFFYW